MTPTGRSVVSTVRSVTVAVACVTALAACTSTTSGSSQTPTPTPSSTAQTSASALATPTPTPSPRPSSATSTSPAALAAILQRIALTRADLADGERLTLFDGGDQVTGQVTLDNCGYDFTSEADRVARRQYGVVTAAGARTGTSNEVVAYDTAAHATRALTQIRTAAATCPTTPVNSNVDGVPALTYRVAQNKAGVPGLPAAMNSLVVESATGDGQTLHNVSIYQVHGRILDAVYANSEQAPTSAEITAALALATATGRRLVSTG